MFSPLTKQLIESLRSLPGVGPKSAQRMAFQLLAEPSRARGLNLAQTLQSALQKIGHCKSCRTFTEQEYCEICNNSKREQTLLCVVENPADMLAIEQTYSYSGLYFILQGPLSPIDGLGPNEIGIPALLERLQTGTISELIIATNPTVEGKATAHYIASRINHTQIKCTRIAHGVPIGGELEYLDSSTLMHAFQARARIMVED